jgi:hypothetical protein
MAIGFILAFLLFLVISFYLYPAINPEAKLSYTGGEVYLYDYASFGPQNLRDMKEKIDELESELKARKSKEMRDIALIDSLFQVSMKMEEELMAARTVGPSTGGGLMGTELAGADGSNFEQDPKVKEIAKSLMRLDEEELRMILSPLSDKQLIQLYATSSNSQREKLLRSLEPLKAANILKRLMS